MSAALVGTAVMLSLWFFTPVKAYIFTATGITTCVGVGYVASLIRGGQDRDLSGLTIFTRLQMSSPRA